MLKNTGYSKAIDNLGRILISKKIREMLNITTHDNLPMYLLVDETDNNAQYLCLKILDKREEKISTIKELLKELNVPCPKELD